MKPSDHTTSLPASSLAARLGPLLELAGGKHALVLRVVGADSNYMDYPVMVAFANAPAAPAQ